MHTDPVSRRALTGNASGEVTSSPQQTPAVGSEPAAARPGAVATMRSAKDVSVASGGIVREPSPLASETPLASGGSAAKSSVGDHIHKAVQATYSWPWKLHAAVFGVESTSGFVGAFVGLGLCALCAPVTVPVGIIRGLVGAAVDNVRRTFAG